MIAIPGNVRVWLATGHTDMRRGFPMRTDKPLLTPELSLRPSVEIVCAAKDERAGASVYRRISMACFRG